MIEAADLKRLNYPAESIDIKECPNCNKEVNIAIYFHHVIAIDFTCCNLTQTYSAFQQRSVKDNIYGGPLQFYSLVFMLKCKQSECYFLNIKTSWGAWMHRLVIHKEGVGGGGFVEYENV